MFVLAVHNFFDAYPTLVWAIMPRRYTELMLRNRVFRILKRTTVTAIEKFARHYFN
jgi:hypothetical protein